MRSNLQLSLELPLTQMIGGTEYSLVDRAFVDRAAKAYSADTLQNNKVRGILSHLGHSWICTSCLYWRNHIFACLHEIVPEWQYVGDTHTKPLTGGRPEGFYTGRIIHHQRNSWVITASTITLCTQNAFHDYNTR